MANLPWLLGGSTVGIVAGFLLGGIGPRMETAGLQSELEKAQAELARRGGVRNRVQFLPIPGLGELEPNAAPGYAEPSSTGPPADPPRGAPPSKSAEPAPRAASEPTEGQKNPEPARAASEEGEGSEPDAGQKREYEREFRAARDLQRARSAQSRAALREKAGLSDEQMARVDLAIADMNQKLAPYADQLVKLAGSNQDPEPLETLYLTQEVSAVLYKGQSDFEAAVGPKGLEAVDRESKQIWNYIDLEMFEGAAGAFRSRREAATAQQAESKPQVERKTEP